MAQIRNFGRFFNDEEAIEGGFRPGNEGYERRLPADRRHLTHSVAHQSHHDYYSDTRYHHHDVHHHHHSTSQPSPRSHVQTREHVNVQAPGNFEHWHHSYHGNSRDSRFEGYQHLQLDVQPSFSKTVNTHIIQLLEAVITDRKHMQRY